MRPTKRGQASQPSYLRNKVYIAWTDAKISAPTERNASAFRYWRSFTRWEWSLVQFLIGGLQRRYIWENWSDDLEQEIIRLMYPENPADVVCPPEPGPEPGPEQPPTPPGGTASSTGSLGLSIEELEGLLMGSVMDIRISGGKLQVQYFPCCDWVDVGNIGALVGSLQGTPQSMLDAVTSGLINDMPPKPISTPVQEGFDNPATLQCVKATAMKYVFQTYLADLRDWLDEQVNNLTIVLGLLAVFLLATPFKGLVSQGTLGNILKQFGKQAVIDAINDFLADETFWNDFVCNVAGDFEDFQDVTGKDISTFYAYMTTQAVAFGEEILALLDALSSVDFQNNVSYSMAHVGCDCDQYLPYGYTPPATTDAINFVKMVNALNPTTTSNNAPSGQPYEQIETTLPCVEQIPPTSWATKYMGLNTNHYAALAILFRCQADVTIQSIKIPFAASNFTSGNMKVQLSAYQVATGWSPDTQSDNAIAGLASPLVYAPAGANSVAQDYVLTIQLRSSTMPQLKVTISDLLFTGIYGGVGFVDKAVGELLG